AVAAAVAGIRRGELTKVVLARQVVLHADRPFAVPDAVDRLVAANPGGAVFAARFGGRWFLGGTPECLVRVADGRVVAHSLAGSVARGATASADAVAPRATEPARLCATTRPSATRTRHSGVPPRNHRPPNLAAKTAPPGFAATSRSTASGTANGRSACSTTCRASTTFVSSPRRMPATAAATA